MYDMMYSPFLCVGFCNVVTFLRCMCQTFVLALCLAFQGFGLVHMTPVVTLTVSLWGLDVLHCFYFDLHCVCPSCGCIWFCLAPPVTYVCWSAAMPLLLDSLYQYV